MRSIRSARTLAWLSAVALLGAGPAAAATYTFDFEDGIDQRSSVRLSGSLDDYMSDIAGRTVDAGDAIWRGSSNTFGSDAIFTSGYTSVLDFDTAGRRASDYAITAVSFEWGIYDATPGRDFGLDVYDDTLGRWRNNVFEVRNARDGDTGVSDRLVFDDAWEITRLRFHDNNSYDVGLDNLTVWDNATIASAVPEPTAALLFATGLVVAGHHGRSRRGDRRA